MKIARPFPLEYFIIDIPTGFPAENTRIDSIFNDQCPIIQTPFAIENRQQIGELQVITNYSSLKIKYFLFD